MRAEDSIVIKRGDVIMEMLNVSFGACERADARLSQGKQGFVFANDVKRGIFLASRSPTANASEAERLRRRRRRIFPLSNSLQHLRVVKLLVSLSSSWDKSVYIASHHNHPPTHTRKHRLELRSTPVGRRLATHFYRRSLVTFPFPQVSRRFSSLDYTI